MTNIHIAIFLGIDKQPLRGSRNEQRLRQSHNNRLGATYDAVYTFMDTRIQTRKQQSSGSQMASRDTVSLILFNSSIEVPFENESFDLTLLFDKMLQHHARG